MVLTLHNYSIQSRQKIMKKLIVFVVGFVAVGLLQVKGQSAGLKMTKYGYDGITPQKIWKVSFPAEYDAIKYGSELEAARRDGNLYMVENANMGVSIVFLENKAVILDYSPTGTEYYFRGIAEYKNNEIITDSLDFCEYNKTPDCEQKTKDIQNYVQNAYKYYLKEIEAYKLAQK
ncbi:MAG: hypothetical protein NZ519_01720 [Bacteroidia bacterium]|nr:hypothetical protein [Bacteroidia bacterium]MDW8301379.1 hypothetical protein [Bacteroidia bacterium]